MKKKGLRLIEGEVLGYWYKIREYKKDLLLTLQKVQPPGQPGNFHPDTASYLLSVPGIKDSK